MKSKLLKNIVSVLLCLLIVLGSGVAAFAAVPVPSSMSQISDIETVLAPGVVQNEKIVYNKDNKRIVYYTVSADITNDDTLDIYCNYKDNQNETFGMATLKEQVASAKLKHDGENYRVVAAQNAAIYNMTTGRPKGAFVMMGNDVSDETEGNKYPFFAILKDGTPMIGFPDEYSQYKGSLKEAVGGVHVLVQNGKNVLKESDFISRAPRSSIGLTADGKVVLMAADGRQEPYSAGLNTYEQAEIMLSLGCVDAIELDGGGSTTYGATLPGTNEFKVLNSPSDGSDRSISNSLMIVSTAEPSGEFDRAVISSDFNLLSPNSSVTLSAQGVDKYGYPLDMPDNCYYRLSDSSKGRIEGDKFIASSKTGDTTVEMVHDGKVIGTKDLKILYPDELAFTKTSLSVAFDSRTPLPIMAYSKGIPTAINAGDLITLAGDIESLEEHPELYGYVDGMDYVAPQESCGIRGTDLYAMFSWDEEGSSIININVTFHKQNEVTFDFENAIGTNGDIAWNRVVSNTMTDNNSEYTIIDRNEDVTIDYTFAMDMRKLRLPDEIQPLWEAFGENLGGQVWVAFLRLANKIDPKSNVTITLNFNPNIEILDISNLSFSCELFALDRENIKFDPATNKMTLPFIWNSDYVYSLMNDGTMKPTDVNPIGVFSGIKLRLKYTAEFDGNGAIPLDLSGNISYSVIAISSNAYGAAGRNSLEEYQYIDPENPGRKGIKIDASYSDLSDKFTLHEILKDGWEGNSYFVNGTALKGMQLVDGYYYDFGESGITEGKYNGFYKFEEGWKYIIFGRIATGWQYIDNSYYWFDSNGLPYDEAKSGKWYVFSNHYSFTEKGKLVSGIWTTSPSSGNTYYYYGPAFYQSTWAIIDGAKYYFFLDGTHATGYSAIEPGKGNGHHLYHFDDEGRLIEEITTEGLFFTGEKYYYIKNGICLRGLAQVGNDFYYFSSSNGFAATGGKVWVENTNGLNFAKRYYNFDTETYKLIHSYTAVVTEPSCESEGYTTYTCSDCGYSYKDNFVPKSHVAADAGTVTAPTCTEKGYTTYTCSKCGETYKSDYVDALGHSYSEAEFVWTEDSSAEYGWTVTAAKTCANCSDKLIAEVTITRTSYKELVASAVFTDGSTASDTKIICGDITLAVINGSGAVITNDKFIYGLAAGLDSIEGYVTASADGCEVKVTKSGDKIGTGTLVEIYKDGYLVDAYTVVIFGDVDGDGWYDAQDAYIVSLITNGLLTREQTGESKYLAADCNHDGVIDGADIEILQNAGLLLGDVDQSKSHEELQSDSVYEEYSSLIEQSPDDARQDDPSFDNSVFVYFYKLIAKIVKYIVSLIPELL